MMIVEIVILVISDEKSLSFMERLYKKKSKLGLNKIATRWPAEAVA